MPKFCCQETWDKIPPDEPIFIIRGKDLISPDTVRQWIEDAERAGVNPNKISRAREHLVGILEFQRLFPERCKIPD